MGAGSGHDHEIDRRYNDQEFKLRITGEIAEIKVNLQHNTDETKVIKDKVDDLHDEMDRTLKGTGRLDTGLVGQALENKIAVDELKHDIKVWLPIVCVIIVLFADQLSPIIREWLAEKTHLGMFQDPVAQFKKEKETVHIKSYHITYKQ